MDSSSDSESDTSPRWSDTSSKVQLHVKIMLGAQYFDCLQTGHRF